MKKLTIILTVFFATMFANEIYAQNYVQIGSSGLIPYCIWKIQVLDYFNNAPLSNAKVEFFEYGRKLGTIRTDNEGIAVFIIYNIAIVQNSWALKITDENHSYTTWEKDIKQYDYYESDIVLYLPGIDWGSTNTQPIKSTIAGMISNDNYYKFDVNSYKYKSLPYYDGEIDLHEFNVRLKYQQHPKDNIYIDGSENSNPNNNLNNNQNEKSFESSWTYKGEIHECFEWVKGDLQVFVGPTGKYLKDKELYRAWVFNKNELIHYGEPCLLSEAKAEAEKLRQKF